jgi:hypothetical protein
MHFTSIFRLSGWQLFRNSERQLNLLYLHDDVVETNARQELLDHLGYDHATIAAAAAAYTDDTVNGVSSMSLQDLQTPKMSKAAEEMVKKALLVGNFEAAVECCFRTGNLADALILASCGGADLWAKTQERYFTSESQKRPFLSVVSAIIHSQVCEIVYSRLF